MTAVDLFMSDDDEEISLCVDKLVRYNRERKATQEKAYEECNRLITEKRNL